MALASTLEIIEEARAGRLFILTDDEGRENEGDLIVPASFAGAAAINFMITHGRGLVCLALEGARARRLDLPMMLRGGKENESAFHTNFTVSIESKEGVTTGISVFDRAHTIAVAIDESKGANDLVVPGHIFPLVAKEGGVLARAGHTEAAVDVARLAGLYPAGVLCEVLKEDGTMARLPDLLSFAEHHGLKVGSIADLIAFRSRAG